MVRSLRLLHDDSTDTARGGSAPAPAADTGTLPNLSAPERPLGPGDTVDRYRIDAMMAAGGMARVYRATHVFTGRTVALKVMRTRFARRPDLIERFQKEAMALSHIRHANVVTIENGGLTEKGEVFIAMEFLEGRTLRDILSERGRLSIRDALTIADQIAQGVGAAHEVHVIHRDLKPENIFCTSDGAVKVLDLGLAKFIGYDLKETDPASSGMIGTAAYIAPERLDGLPIDARCDIYALGLITYECLAGFHPLVPDGVWPSSEEIALRQLTFDPPPLRQLPPELWAAIARAMHKNRERRFATIHEMAAVLRRLRDDLAAIPQHASAAPSPSDGASRAAGPSNAPPRGSVASRSSPVGADSSSRVPGGSSSSVASGSSSSVASGSSSSVAGGARSLDGQVVARASATAPERGSRGRPRFLDTVLQYPMIAGALIGLLGAFGLFFWQRSHAPPTPASALTPQSASHTPSVASRSPSAQFPSTEPAPSNLRTAVQSSSQALLLRPPTATSAAPTPSPAIPPATATPPRTASSPPPASSSSPPPASSRRTASTTLPRATSTTPPRTAPSRAPSASKKSPSRRPLLLPSSGL